MYWVTLAREDGMKRFEMTACEGCTKPKSENCVHWKYVCKKAPVDCPLDRD